MRIHYIHSSKWSTEVHLFSLSRWENWGSRCEGIHPRPHTQLVNEKVWNPVQANLTSTFPPHTPPISHQNAPLSPAKKSHRVRKELTLCPGVPTKVYDQRIQSLDPTISPEHLFQVWKKMSSWHVGDIHGLQRACSHLTVVTSRTSLQGDSALTAPI